MTEPSQEDSYKKSLLTAIKEDKLTEDFVEKLFKTIPASDDRLKVNIIRFLVCLCDIEKKDDKIALVLFNVIVKDLDSINKNLIDSLIYGFDSMKYADFDYTINYSKYINNVQKIFFTMFTSHQKIDFLIHAAKENQSFMDVIKLKFLFNDLQDDDKQALLKTLALNGDDGVWKYFVSGEKTLINTKYNESQIKNLLLAAAQGGSSDIFYNILEYSIFTKNKLKNIFFNFTPEQKTEFMNKVKLNPDALDFFYDNSNNYNKDSVDYMIDLAINKKLTHQNINSKKQEISNKLMSWSMGAESVAIATGIATGISISLIGFAAAPLLFTGLISATIVLGLTSASILISKNILDKKSNQQITPELSKTHDKEVISEDSSKVAGSKKPKIIKSPDIKPQNSASQSEHKTKEPDPSQPDRFTFP